MVAAPPTEGRGSAGSRRLARRALAPAASSCSRRGSSVRPEWLSGYPGPGRSRGTAGIGRIARFRVLLQRASAGRPWPACALSPQRRVFRCVEVMASHFALAGRRAGHSRWGCVDRTLFHWRSPVRLDQARRSRVARLAARTGLWPDPLAEPGHLRASFRCPWVGRHSGNRGIGSIARTGHPVAKAVECPRGVGQAVASCASMPRKVRAPQGTVPGNAWAARADGKCNREQTADGPAHRKVGRDQARVKRCGKSAPRAWQQAGTANPTGSKTK